MVLFIYKLLRGCSELLSLISFNIPTRNVRHRMLFVMPYARVNVFKYSVIIKCMHVANEFLLSYPTFDLFFQSISNLKCNAIALLDIYDTERH